jgi:phosphopantothenate synthetase
MFLVCLLMRTRRAVSLVQAHPLGEHLERRVAARIEVVLQRVKSVLEYLLGRQVCPLALALTGAMAILILEARPVASPHNMLRRHPLA